MKRSTLSLALVAIFIFFISSCAPTPTKANPHLPASNFSTEEEASLPTENPVRLSFDEKENLIITFNDGSSLLCPSEDVDPEWKKDKEILSTGEIYCKIVANINEKGAVNYKLHLYSHDELLGEILGDCGE